MNVLLIDSTTKIVEHEINLYNFTCFADIAEELNIDSVTLIPLDESETQDYPTFCFNKDKTINEIIFDFIELSDEDQSIVLAYNQYIDSYLNNMDEKYLESSNERIVLDYISGMTDDYFISSYKKICLNKEN